LELEVRRAKNDNIAVSDLKIPRPPDLDSSEENTPMVSEESSIEEANMETLLEDDD
jgi:hypothetical protein